MYLTHLGTHNWANAGDTVLFAATRDLLDRVKGPHYWDLAHLQRIPPKGYIEHINREIDAVVIGGGGLLVPGKNRATPSGWFCPLTLQDLQQINKPIIVFAVGNSRFRRQVDFNETFKSHINQLLKQSVFFSLRNQGSIRSLKPYIKDTGLWAKICYQPCPASVLNYIYKGEVVQENYELAFVPAMDMSLCRYGDRQNEILQAIAKALKWASNSGWHINLVMHRAGVIADNGFKDWLDREHLDYAIISLCKIPPKDVLAFYRKIPLVIGMRGHSAMMPFGLGNAAISVISNNKITWFLEDIGHPEWGIDVEEEGLKDKLIRKIEYMSENKNLIREQIAVAQDRLWKLTCENLRRIGQILA